MINFDNLTDNKKEELLNMIKKQIFIDFIADIEYQCFYEKISEDDFFKRELKWNFEI